jgi:hypothetical protein
MLVHHPGIMKTIRSAWAAAVLGCATASAAILGNPVITQSAPAFSGSYLATNVFDDRETDYASQSRGFGPSLSTTQGTFLEFDFGSAVTINRFVNVTRRNDVDVIFTERLIFSNDPVFDLSDPFVDLSPVGQNGNGFIKSFSAQTARFVRWEVRDGALNPGGFNANNFGSVEMRFLSPTAGLVPLSTSVIGGAQPFDGTFALANAANGDAGRAGSAGIEYASASLGPNMFVDFDMGSVKPIGGFDFYDRFGVDPSLALVDRVNSFDLIFSNDSTFGSVIATRSFTPGSWGYSQQFAPVNARYVRFDATSTANGTSNSGIQEMTFYAAPEPGTGALLICGALVCAKRRRMV